MGTGEEYEAKLPLAASYDRCRRVHRQHGRSYYLATRLLPAAKRRHVHALYALARHADDIVDSVDTPSVAERARSLADWSDRLCDNSATSNSATRNSATSKHDSHTRHDGDVLLPAIRHTIRVLDLDPDDIARFLASMAMDLTVTSYRDYPELLRYMEGSAAAIGTLVLPILGSPDPAAAREPARQLGLAFQLTNFIRDVAEDLGRGRVYLPMADLQRFGVTRAGLESAAVAGAASAEIQALVEYEVSRARAHYALAAPGIALLDRRSQPCVRVAYRVYGAILDEIERADHDVFRRRATVATHRRLALAAAAVFRVR